MMGFFCGCSFLYKHKDSESKMSSQSFSQTAPSDLAVRAKPDREITVLLDGMTIGLVTVRRKTNSQCYSLGLDYLKADGKRGFVYLFYTVPCTSA